MNLPALLIDHWRRFRGSDRYAESLRVGLALGGIVAWCLARRDVHAVIPALLGAIACALAETEDHWRSRLGTLLLTLACFAIAAMAVQWLLPTPWLFAASLPLATFALVMLGAASGRYATIAGGTLILSVYTMIGVDAAHGSFADPWREPLLLLAGAGWYGVLSLAWSALAPQQALRLALARSFDALADYLDGKAELFAPVHGVDREAMQLQLALRNERVVQALNATRLVLVDRIGNRRPRGTTAARLQLYFMAQDIHERANSTHHPYDALAEVLFHSDVLFRCGHLLRLQADGCRARAAALRLRVPFRRSPIATAALADLHDAVAAMKAQASPPPVEVQHAVEALAHNLEAIQIRLGDATRHAPAVDDGLVLQDPGPQTLGEAWDRVRIQFTPRSMHFRHALRLALALLAGYLVLLAVHPRQGYWILLTTLLVCQPTYGATRRLLLERVAGTVLGLVAGWATLKLAPFGTWQMGLIVLTGVGFFATRQRRYALATAFITLFVLLCFNQIGNGYSVMWPRLLDTLIGAGIAALAIYLVLPDWRGRQLAEVLAEALRSDARYLERILAQYASGKQDDLAYRIARRDAHNADAALSGQFAAMLREPDRAPASREALLRFLTAAHLLLGQLSALGAHRQAIPARALASVQASGRQVVGVLDDLAETLSGNGDRLPVPAEGVFAPPAGEDDTSRFVLGQLTRVMTQYTRLAGHARELVAR
ncbi:YccS family putative transporter [Dyella ginsengisoli]|uniref:YccS family putative transporter n=1 Tax=Dyella ginsengisoli TaxID=363848 RepID=UPI00034752F4|nr:YccS family putative transporter [Dyella ginsengisoli]